jgi:hypothetical protein
MALAYALHYLETNGLARLTNYAEFLERNPPALEVEIVENSSWSCAHGVERWRSDCGCTDGPHARLGQAWRAPLRSALDWLRDETAWRFEAAGRRLLGDPWRARDQAVALVLDRSPEALEGFLARNAAAALGEAERVAVRKLLELARHTQLMYTSCGWFFDDLSRIETRQILQYAGRAVELAEDLFGEPFEPGFLARLEQATSGLPGEGNGRRIYEKYVRPSRVSLERVGAHYAVSSLFENYGARTRIFCYTIDREDDRRVSAGKARLLLGRARIASEVTGESRRVEFGVLHLGDHDLTGGTREFQGEVAWEELAGSIRHAFERGDLTEVVRMLDRSFGPAAYSLRLLFRDEQRKVLRRILESKLVQAEEIHRRLSEEHAPILRYLADLGVSAPREFLVSTGFVLNRTLRRELEEDEPDLDRIGALVAQARMTRARLDGEGLTYAFQRAIDRSSARVLERPEDTARLRRLGAFVSLSRELPLPAGVDLGKAQNACYRLLEVAAPNRLAAVAHGDADARDWNERFRALADELGVRVDLPAS